MLDAIFSGLSARVLLQDQDLAFGFEAVSMPGQFVVRGFEVKEALFEPYEIRVELASDEPDLDLNELIDTDACVTVYDKYSQPRYFHGVISEAEAGDTGVHRSFYFVVLKPTLHRLQYVSDSRIFQEMTVQDVVTVLFQENGLANFEWRISEAHSTREYCVCYGEHLYDFIRRLLAEEGIFFWFEHHADAHRLVLSDAPWSMPALEHAPAITYNANPAGMTRGSYINTFTQSQKVRSTDLLQKDYFFKNPA